MVRRALYFLKSFRGALKYWFFVHGGSKSSSEALDPGRFQPPPRLFNIPLFLFISLFEKKFLKTKN